MSCRTQLIRLIVLLLLGIFLAAQFHTCDDMSLGVQRLPACPLCSTAGSAVVPQGPSIVAMTFTKRLEILATVLPLSLHPPRDLSPRGPPAL